MNRTFLLVVFTMLIQLQGQAQSTWSTPQQLTVGSSDERSATIANVPDMWVTGITEEWMAFVRDGRNICLKRTESNGASWSQSVYCIPNDSAQFSHPSLTYARLNGSSDVNLVLVWQGSEYPSPGSNILYSVYGGGSWGAPTLLTNLGAGDRNPHVAPRDSGVGVVWERGGKIMFSEFKRGAWSPPEFVSAPGDTLNSLPQIQYERFYPVILWKRQIPNESSSLLLCSVKKAATWKIPDTVARVAARVEAKFFKAQDSWNGFSASWGGVDNWIRMLNGSYIGSDSLRHLAEIYQVWLGSDTLLNPSVNSRSIPIPTEKANFVWFAAATSQYKSRTNDSGVVALTLFDAQPTLFASSNLVGYRNATISGGVWSQQGLRLWSVWEGHSAGRSSLYGSSALIHVSDVGNDGTPGSFRLDQNYPNPFNPMTNIEFRIANFGFVSLKVSDILGREVAILVNEVKQPGEHTVRWNAEGLASGIYLYQLRAGGFVQTRKMMIIR
ncbi:MAG: T9SS type A sorting domain-containing protein [Ignavibacteriae bacterium]|nr:T9SS type A sorting domain-containing protein [Ignavibacteriota bacterium]